MMLCLSEHFLMRLPQASADAILRNCDREDAVRDYGL
jgi:hypothetical protein